MEENENTFGKYLGPEFQLKLLWQILVDSEFGDKTVPDISVDYFDDFTQKKLFIVIRDYYRENEKVPSLSNDSIRTAIYKNNNQTNNEHDLEELKANVDKIQRWEDRVSNGKTENDGYIVQKDATTFIKQQEYRRLGELILSKTKSGEIAKKTFVGDIEEKVNKIGCIGDVEDNGTLLTEGVERALRKEFRETIPTGIKVIDTVTGGGLGKGEVGIILAPSGVGKSTLLTKIANSGYEMGKNILQIIFEDKDEEIKRKHYSIWSGIPLSEFNNNEEEVNALVNKKIKTIKKGLLKIKRFSEEDTTMINVKNWIIKNQKKNNLKYDEIILDYLDCLESHKKASDRNEAELIIIKSFLALAANLNVPCWSAIQGNRGSFNREYLEAIDSGGNIKRIQKSHFFMSVAKPDKMSDTNLVNVNIMKARFAKDGQRFEDSTLDTDTMEINFNDQKYDNKYSKSRTALANEMVSKINYKASEKINDDLKILEDDYVKSNNNQNMIHTLVSSKLPVPYGENNIKIENVNTINEIFNNLPLESEIDNSILELKIKNEINEDIENESNEENISDVMEISESHFEPLKKEKLITNEIENILEKIKKKRGKPSRITDEIKNIVFDFYKNGFDNKYIANNVGYPISGVSNILKERGVIRPKGRPKTVINT